MSRAGAKLGIGTHFRLDGETVQVVEFASLAPGVEVVLKDGRDRLARMSVRELLTPGRAQVIPSSAGPAAADDADVAAVVLDRLTKKERKIVLERAEHVREMLSGYRSGSEELPGPDEPRAQYLPGRPLRERYAAGALARQGRHPRDAAPRSRTSRLRSDATAGLHRVRLRLRSPQGR